MTSLFSLLPKCWLIGGHVIVEFFSVCIILGTLPHNIICLEVTADVTWCYMNKLDPWLAAQGPDQKETRFSEKSTLEDRKGDFRRK